MAAGSTFTRRKTAIAANEKTANLLVNHSLETLQFNARIVCGFTCTAAKEVQASWSVGGDIQLDDVDIADDARMPRNPDDLIFSSGGVAGDRMEITLRETGNLASTFYWAFVVATPL